VRVLAEESVESTNAEEDPEVLATVLPGPGRAGRAGACAANSCGHAVDGDWAVVPIEQAARSTPQVNQLPSAVCLCPTVAKFSFRDFTRLTHQVQRIPPLWRGAPAGESRKRRVLSRAASTKRRHSSDRVSRRAVQMPSTRVMRAFRLQRRHRVFGMPG